MHIFFLFSHFFANVFVRWKSYLKHYYFSTKCYKPFGQTFSFYKKGSSHFGIHFVPSFSKRLNYLITRQKIKVESISSIYHHYLHCECIEYLAVRLKCRPVARIWPGRMQKGCDAGENYFWGGVLVIFKTMFDLFNSGI